MKIFQILTLVLLTVVFTGSNAYDSSAKKNQTLSDADEKALEDLSVSTIPVAGSGKDVTKGKTEELIDAIKNGAAVAQF